jgi:hypothetical protein
MNKNAVIITSMKGLVDNSCEEYCLNTWKPWCSKNNIDLIILDEPIADTNYTKPTWQRWYVWDVLENSGLDYEKVALIDVDTMIHWDSPNIFNEIEDEIGVCVDNDNIGWVNQSIKGYKHMFNTSVDWTEYFNCGVVVLNKSSKDFCSEIIKFWEKNHQNLVTLQNTLRKGTDQTPVNYIAKNYKVKYLNKKYNLTHLNRKEILNSLEFISCGYIFHFNGFDKSHRTPLMKQTWENVKHNYED